jgi:hypothetical protein
LLHGLQELQGTLPGASLGHRLGRDFTRYFNGESLHGAAKKNYMIGLP